jgi:hypothetical protein
MKLKQLFICLLIIWVSTLKGQTKNNSEFENYAKIQGDLMTKEYENKNAKEYSKVLNNVTSKYEKLSIEEKKQFKNFYINSVYNLCCTYSLIKDKENALKYLEESLILGYSDYGHLKADTDLDNIRNEEKYKILTEPLRKAGDYLSILKKAGEYNIAENGELPKFTYQSADNQNLIELNKAFKLDSIAGKGNEVSKIINLMHWIHNLVPHDGNHENPVVKNAMSMLSVCKKDKRGLNCRGLATVLNECYLSIGIKSRFITCIPKDSLGIDPDCHVINMVYSKQVKKWLWIDPTHDAYVMNEKGELLSIEEVRERLVNDKQLILNPDANWNHLNSATKEDYLENYMAKNLYILECPLNSEYDLETRLENKEINYLRLIPLEYFKKSLEKGISTDNKNRTKIITYRTNNPNLFWQVP